MRRLGIFLFSLFCLASCSGDIERNITTDLQVEGNEIFRISLSLEESAYFALLTLDEYKRLDPTRLPGCPDIFVNDQESKVTLFFSRKSDCPNQLVPRKGRINILFQEVSATENRTILSYEDYEVRETRLEGSRQFSNLRNSSFPNRITETFQDLFILDKNNSSSRLNGTFNYQLTMVNRAVTGYLVQGSLEGRNITGRRIVMEQSTPKRYEVSCLESGKVLALQGVERWQIFRNATASVTHTLVYEPESECTSKASITLQDGRILAFSL